MNDNETTEYLENITHDELTVGRTASLTRTLTKEDILLFATVSGDVNPAHMDEAYANSTMFHGIIGHGMFLGGLISTVLGTIMPGPGTIYLGQELKFKAPIRVGDKITVILTVKSRREDKPIVTFDCQCVNQAGDVTLEGTATVLAPKEKIRQQRTAMPEVEIRTYDRYQSIMQTGRDLPPVNTAVVHAVKPHVLEAVADATRQNLIVPVLIGPTARIIEAAETAKVDISQWRLIDTKHSYASALKAAELAASGEAQAMMKGAIHTSELLAAITPTESLLHTGRYFSHTYVMDVPGYHKMLFVSDAVVNIEPDLETKADICQNAIDLWRLLYGKDKLPKVAILASVEQTMSKLPTTVSAAALSKMAERGQITNAIVDGPLALDNALSKQAAAENGIHSDVAGDTDILIAPNMEAANILARRLNFLGHSDAAGIILGARVPIIVPRPTDNLRTRLFSCSLAVFLADEQRKNESSERREQARVKGRFFEI
jgi:phosphate acetyltransferase